eukprot:4585116-Pleurochrysis_carterae.AAC.2
MATPASEGAAQMFSPPTVPLSEVLMGESWDYGTGWTGRERWAPRAGEEGVASGPPKPVAHRVKGGIALVRPRRKAPITTAEAEGAGAGSSHPQRLAHSRQRGAPSSRSHTSRSPGQE